MSATINGTFTFGGLPRNDVTAKLWSAGRFSSAPQKGTALPSGSPTSSTTTGGSHGGDGSYSFSGVPEGAWWISFEYAGEIAWEHKTTGPVNVRDYGAAGDGVTDDAAAIQAAIDAAMASTSGGTVVLPRGRFLIGTPLLLAKVSGGSWQFAGVTLQGGGATNQDVNSETEIVCNFVDKPAIIVQFARWVRLRDLVITGGNAIDSLVDTVAELLDDSNFVTGGCRDNRYSPHAGVCIDPFHADVSSGDRYPGMSSYYTNGPGGNGGSSGVEIDGCHIRNFVVGVMITPAATVQQGDVITISNCDIRNNKTHIAVGQSQSRGVNIIGGLFAGSKFFVSTSEYGQQNGPCPYIFGPTIVRTKYLFDIASNFGTGAIVGLYCENTISIGFLGKDIAGTAQPICFYGCSFNFAPTALRPDFHIRNVGPVLFSGCDFQTDEKPMSVWSLATRPIRYEACFFRLTEAITGHLYATANVSAAFEEFVNCAVFDDVLGPVGGVSVMSRDRIAFQPTYDQHDKSLVAPGAWIRYQSTSDIHSVAVALGIISLGTVTITVDGAGGATFTASSNADLAQVGDLVHTFTGFTPETTSGGTEYNAANILAGKITAVAGSDITLDSVPQSLETGSHDLRIVYWKRFHQATTGDVTSASNQITNVSVPGSWETGHRIAGTGIPSGAVITNVSGATLTISKNATATNTGVRLYDADVSVFTGTPY